MAGAAVDGIGGVVGGQVVGDVGLQAVAGGAGRWWRAAGAGPGAGARAGTATAGREQGGSQATGQGQGGNEMGTGHGVHFLGCDIYPTGRRLRRRVLGKIKQRLNFSNISSYRALTVTHSKQSIVKWIDWNIIDMLDQL
jgi:hypothetical protein